MGVSGQSYEKEIRLSSPLRESGFTPTRKVAFAVRGLDQPQILAGMRSGVLSDLALAAFRLLLFLGLASRKCLNFLEVTVRRDEKQQNRL